MTKNHKIYSFKHKRAECGAESLAMQGIPTAITKQAAAAATAAFSSTDSGAKCDSELMPVAEAILETVSEAALRGLAGNGWLERSIRSTSCGRVR